MQGVQTGHDPDSVEFSTLGGWVATRCSGMKKNVYGNIEDMLCNVKMVTPRGTIMKENDWPRVSSGPDLMHLALGSEGNFGVVTEAVLRIRPVPEVIHYGSVVFHDLEEGIRFMHEVAKSRIWPASVRLVDNIQFKLGAALKPASDSKWEEYMEKFKQFFLVNVKGYDLDKISACILLFEGTKQLVEY